MGRSGQPAKRARHAGRRAGVAGGTSVGVGVSAADAEVAAAGGAGKRGAGGHLSGPGRTGGPARVCPPRPLGHQAGRLPADSPAPGRDGTGRRQPPALARVVVRLAPPDAARHLDRRGPLAVRPAKGVRRPRAGNLHDRPGGMGPFLGPAADQAATAQPVRRADAQALAERGPAAGRGAAFRRPAAAVLALLVHEAQRRVEARLREHIRPQIAAALDAVGLVPQNLPNASPAKN